MSDACFELSDVSAGYHRAFGAPVSIVHVPELAIRTGECWCIRGPSGSGKTTLLYLLNRFEEPLSGSVFCFGEPLSSRDPVRHRREVMLVPQVPVMFDGTVGDNLTLVPRDLSAPSRERQLAALKAVQLEESLLAQRADQLSVGQHQRVSIARALVRQPRVLLLDEPTASLDKETAEQLLSSLSSRREPAFESGEVASRGGTARVRPETLIIVSHQVELMRRFATHHAVIDQGRLRVEAPSAAVNESQTEGGDA